MKNCLLSLCVLFCVFAAIVGAAPVKAVCNLTVTTANITGLIQLSQKDPNSPTEITLEIHGLTPNSFHGFHVHALGNLTGGCDSTGPHFNPTNKTHGAPWDEERHVGDLGNLISDANGIAKKIFKDTVISLSGTNNIVGRAFVVHEGRDDYGQGGFPDSKTTGHAGARIACGLIQYVQSDMDELL